MPATFTPAQIDAAALTMRIRGTHRLTIATMIGQLHATREPVQTPDADMLAWQEEVYANGLGNTVHGH
jgi:anthranilate phosphoribosyltransferase